MSADRLHPLIFRQFNGRCRICYLRQESCFCSQIKEIDNPTALTVIMHHRETYKTTNTARLAALALANSEVQVRGLPQQKLELEYLLAPTPISLFLTLDEKAQELSPSYLQTLRAQHGDRPFRLVVPDGNWGQAHRMGRREPVLQQIPWVKLPPGPTSRYRLRYEHDAEGLSTLEAIGRAMTLLDGTTRVESHMLHLFETMVERTLSSRPLMREARKPGT